MTRPAIHPGEHIADELEFLDVSASALAKELSSPTNGSARESDYPCC